MDKKIRILIISLAVIVATVTMLTGVAMAGDSYSKQENTSARSVQQNVYYTVVKGDTLYEISKAYNTTAEKLMRYNRLEEVLIIPGQKIYLPLQSEEQLLAPVISRNNINISREELMLLAHLIHAEARGENFTGQVAVGAVVLNRASSPYFPETIRDVIMQKTYNLYQFSPVGDGSINLTPDENAIQAALQALKGEDPTNGALFFYNPDISSDKWIRTLPVITKIGNHVFAAKKA